MTILAFLIFLPAASRKPSKKQPVISTEQLFNIIKQGDANLLERLLEQKRVNLASVDEEGNSVLMLAISHGHEELVRVLATVDGAESLINMQNLEGNTALHFAYALGREKEATFLKEHGADIALSNMYGLFPREGLRPRRFSDLPQS